MENIEIDRKLAEKMGYEVVGNNPTVAITDKYGHRTWNPSENMSDAWKVAERFGLCEIRREENPHAWVAVFTDGFEENQLHQSFSYRDKSAPMAICLAALKVIEGRNDDD
jgi:hypothetical protein